MRTLVNCSIVVVLSLLLAAPAAFAHESSSSSTSLKLDDEFAMGSRNYPRRPPRRFRRARRGPRPTLFYFGIGGIGNFFIESDEEITQVYDGGGGFMLMFGLRLSRMLAFEINYFAAFQSTERICSNGVCQNPRDASLQAISLDGKIYVVPWSTRFQPFLQIGLGAYFLAEEFSERLTGIGLDLGLGIDFKLTRFLGLGFRVLYRGFHVDNSDSRYNTIPTQSAFLNTITIDGSVQFHF